MFCFINNTVNPGFSGSEGLKNYSLLHVLSYSPVHRELSLMELWMLYFPLCWELTSLCLPNDRVKYNLCLFIVNHWVWIKILTQRMKCKHEAVWRQSKKAICSFPCFLWHMEACSTVKVHISFQRCLFCLISSELFNHKYLCVCWGVNINVMVQWEVVAKADVLSSCALPGVLSKFEMSKRFSPPLGLSFWWAFVTTRLNWVKLLTSTRLEVVKYCK